MTARRLPPIAPTPPTAPTPVEGRPAKRADSAKQNAPNDRKVPKHQQTAADRADARRKAPNKQIAQIH
jgi:hypothetical protein